MDLKHKIGIAAQAILSISAHSDEDAAVVKAALDMVISIAEKHKADIDATVAAHAAALLKKE